MLLLCSAAVVVADVDAVALAAVFFDRLFFIIALQ